jgi:aryl-alcohol dehydrogenase-like predicted oxidoreductase
LVRHCFVGDDEEADWLCRSLEPEQNGILEFCQEQGITLVAYSPLGRGILTGQIRSPDDVKGDHRATWPRFQPENFQKNFDVVEEFEKLAAKKGVKAGQLGLAWLMKQGTGILPLFGTRSVERVKENLEALNVSLTEAENQEIRDVVDKAAAGGDLGNRYPEGMEHLQLRDTPALKE